MTSEESPQTALRHEEPDRRRQRLPLRKRAAVVLISSGLAVLLAILALVCDGLCDEIGRADVALVLGSKVEPDGVPSDRLRARLDRTLKLHRKGHFPTIVASGGIGREGYDEAAVMRDYLIRHGVPAHEVIADNQGRNTYESARNVRRIMADRRWQSVLVVSQYFHVPRSKLALRRFGVEEVYSAHARFVELRDLYSTVRELIAYPRYLFRRYDPVREGDR